MAIISDVSLVIDRESHSAGSICTVVYSYALHCTPEEIHSGLDFFIEVELMGHEFLLDRHLGKVDYDHHKVRATAMSREERRFIVPCDVLDAELGWDKIYLVVRAVTSLGVMTEARSETIRDHF